MSRYSKAAPICAKDCLARMFDKEFAEAIKNCNVPDPVWIANLGGCFNPGRLRAFLSEATDLVGKQTVIKLLNNDLFVVPKKEYMQLSSYVCLLESAVDAFFSQFAAIRSGRLAEEYYRELNQTHEPQSTDKTHHQQPSQEQNNGQ